MSKGKKRCNGGAKKMRIKGSLKALTCSVVLVFGLGTMSHAGMVPDAVDINLQKTCSSIKGLPKDKKMVKGFSHKAHAETYLKGNEKYSITPYTDEFTCTACHTGAKAVADLAGDGVCSGFQAAFEAHGSPAKFQNYFHKTCKGCHKAMKKDGLKTGPVSCKGCHKRQEK